MIHAQLHLCISLILTAIRAIKTVLTKTHHTEIPVWNYSLMVEHILSYFWKKSSKEIAKLCMLFCMQLSLKHLQSTGFRHYFSIPARLENISLHIWIPTEAWLIP